MYGLLIIVYREMKIDRKKKKPRKKDFIKGGIKNALLVAPESM
jgi:hypothetical protein